MLKLKEASLNWAIKNINKYQDTSVFPVPFEFEAINENWQEVLNYLKNLDVLTYGVGSYRSEITPNSHVGFGITTQLDPLDSILFNAIVYEISEIIESTRIAKTMNIVHSYRMAPDDDGNLYDSKYSRASFESSAAKCSEEPSNNFVVLTSIAEFYPSIYLHNIESRLRDVVAENGKRSHAEILIKTIREMHINQTHKGLPIGPQFSIPIAELLLNDIDLYLVENQIEFVRYGDDYRLFSPTKKEAYKNLALLAQTCFGYLNCKLNDQKTMILSREAFHDYQLQPDKQKSTEIQQIQQAMLHHMGTIALLKSELLKDDMDVGLIQYVLNSQARIDDLSVTALLFSEDYLVRLTPIMKTFVNYLDRVRGYDNDQKSYIDQQVLSLFDNKSITQLKFNRMWFLNLFTLKDETHHKDTFVDWITKYSDSSTRRELYLASGRSKAFHYFRENKMAQVGTWDPWERRAFIAGISCLPVDERNQWFSSRQHRQRDFLEMIVEKWAQRHPF